MQKIYYDFKFTTLNEYIDAERTNKYKAAKIKNYETYCVKMMTLKKLKKINKKVDIKFIWHEKNRNRDPDNIAFAKKFILDGIVNAGVLDNDGHKQINGFSDEFVFSGKYGVEVIFKEV